MALCRTPFCRLACLGICLVAVGLGYLVVDAARLAATKAAKGEAAAKLEKSKTPEEIQKEKGRLESLKAEIEALLKDSKEYRQSQRESDWP